jgi:hypothetical protein
VSGKVILPKVCDFATFLDMSGFFVTKLLKEEKMSKLYAGSWNYKQNAPHRQPLDEYLEESVVFVLKREPQDWILVVIGEYEVVGRYLTNFEKDLEKWGKRPLK